MSATSVCSRRTDDLLHRMTALETVGEDVVVGGEHARELQRRHHRQHLMTLHDRPPSGGHSGGSRPPAGGEAAGPRASGSHRRRQAGWRYLPGEDVEHDVGAAGAAYVERFGTGRLDRLQPVLQHRREDPGRTACRPSLQPVSRARMRPSALRAVCQPLKGAPCTGSVRRASASGSARSATDRKRSRRARSCEDAQRRSRRPGG